MYLAGLRFENFYYEEELLGLICRQEGLDFQPGDEFAYSNSGYFLLGVIAKRVTGKSLPALLQEHILDPLGMSKTSFNDDAGRIVKNRAGAYSPKEGGYRNDMSFNGGFGDGVLLSTLEDLFLWDQNFYRNKLGGGGEDLIREVLTPGALNNGHKLGYAYGLWVGEQKGLRRIGHAGGWAGYRSDFIQFPEQKFSSICLANLSSIEPWSLNDRVADLYLAKYFAETKPPVNAEKAAVATAPAAAPADPPLPADRWAEYVGVYHARELGAAHTILLEAGQLSVRRGYAAPETMQPAAQDLFQAGELKYQFEREAQDRVCAFTLQAGRVKAIRFTR
jgi:CubicO group peptidase (beta-lactamase class C family)